MILTDFTDLVGARMRSEHRTLAVRWFARLQDLLPVDARDIFPTDSLLDHIPALIVEISDYLSKPEAEAIAANTAILEKARELGALRHEQRASLHQVLREYQVLSGVLVTFVVEEIERADTAPPTAGTAMLVSRLHQAVAILSQATVEAFVGLYTKTIADQAERLDQFTRMAAHEWRQPLGALQFGVSLLRQPDVDPSRADRTLANVERNVQHLVDLTHKLEVIARIRNGGDNPIVQAVEVTTIAQEAARQLREMADARGVDIRISDALPRLTIDVGRLELAFLNLLSNAIKYSDPVKPVRQVDVVSSEVSEPGGWCRIEVRDNGVGIPDGAVTTIFDRFTRAHADHSDFMDVGGVGLGLSIVDDCVRVMGGRIEVQSVEREGTTFIMTLPTSPPTA